MWSMDEQGASSNNGREEGINLGKRKPRGSDENEGMREKSDVWGNQKKLQEVATCWGGKCVADRTGG